MTQAAQLVAQVHEDLKETEEQLRNHPAFLDSFANAPSIEMVALEIIQDGLDHGVDPRRIQRATRLFQSYEQQFWDTMARIVGF